jgi:hypothetical protein
MREQNQEKELEEKETPKKKKLGKRKRIGVSGESKDRGSLTSPAKKRRKAR